MAHDLHFEEFWKLVHDDAKLFTVEDAARLGITCKLLYRKFKPYYVAALVERHRALRETVAMLGWLLYGAGVQRQR